MGTANKSGGRNRRQRTNRTAPTAVMDHSSQEQRHGPHQITTSGHRQGCIGRGGAPRPPGGHPAYAQPLSPRRQVPASVAFVTDSNRPQPLRQPPPTACLAAPGAASEVPSLLLHPWSWSPRPPKLPQVPMVSRPAAH